MSQRPTPRLAALGSGVLVLFAVTVGPLAMLDHEFLTAHMVQHLLLMTVAAPLILLGAHRPPGAASNDGATRRTWPRPASPLCATFSKDPLKALLRWLPAQLGNVMQRITNPVFCWLAGTCTVIGWHIPAAFAVGMRSNLWHDAELVSFFMAGMLFWWPVIQPRPGVATWPRWSVPLYLFLATLPCDALSAFLTFCGRLAYPHYAGAGSAQADQERAGALMWIWVTFAYLAPAVAVAMRNLAPVALRKPGRDRQVAGSTTSPDGVPFERLVIGVLRKTHTFLASHGRGSASAAPICTNSLRGADNRPRGRRRR